eukprot:CAMPEP_0203867604 /NCGR_PEP_ID=MMETSP0359-20131031/16619_1 /ASSEMBLY_ACC=CAM_ASM_000338 /TAXON_ID=268821 /ORGANISM="Scrippsiella Hangoei, Strain SHTV-5" /LENGTH=454 /DNA_ID=CAMNT_0050785881 /DNA_START=1 /DNA_END=1365 /DNA_ORIENTATION=-
MREPSRMARSMARLAFVAGSLLALGALPSAGHAVAVAAGSAPAAQPEAAAEKSVAQPQQTAKASRQHAKNEEPVAPVWPPPTAAPTVARPTLQSNATSGKPAQGDSCTCECSWVSDTSRDEICNSDGDHSCCWYKCCTATTNTATTSATVTTTTVTTTAITTTTVTTTTKTATTANTMTTTIIGTSNRTETQTRTTTSTTTAYCLDSDRSWEQIDMLGSMPQAEDDAWACQARCASTQGCFHFSYHKFTKLCHLQDAFAVSRTTGQEGYISGPFRCPSYLDSGKFTKVDENSYLPKRFECMRPGAVWSPDMTLPRILDGDREQVLESCKGLCDGTDGCKHFTVVFPATCHLIGADAKFAAGVANVMSGSASAVGCDETREEQPSFIMKSLRHAEVAGNKSRQQFLLRAAALVSFLGGGTILGAVAAALSRWRTARQASRSRGDGEEYVELDQLE